MDELKYISEGYYDPVVYEALTKIEREEREARRKAAYRPLVYICSPYAGDMEGNARRAREYCRFAVAQNCIPLAPHLYFPQFMEECDPEQRSLGIAFGLVLQGRCREVWVFGRRISRGMAVEIEKAKERNLRLRYFTEECEEVGTE